MILISGCAVQPEEDSYYLTKSEKASCDSLQPDPAIVHYLRKYSAAPVTPFHYSYGKMYSDSGITELDPIRRVDTTSGR